MYHDEFQLILGHIVQVVKEGYVLLSLLRIGCGIHLQ